MKECDCMSRNLYDIIENSDLTMRSRIDLKKEIKSNKITDENTLLIRINQKKEEELKQIEEKLNDDNNISSTNPISNKSGLKHKIEEGDYVPSTKELYSYVISSNTSQRFKDKMKKEIKTANEYQDIIQKVKEEENITKLISIVNKSDLSFSSKRKMINQINKGEIINESYLELWLMLYNSKFSKNYLSEIKQMITNKEIKNKIELEMLLILYKSNLTNKERIEKQIIKGQIKNKNSLKNEMKEVEEEEKKLKRKREERIRREIEERERIRREIDERKTEENIKTEQRAKKHKHISSYNHDIDESYGRNNHKNLYG